MYASHFSIDNIPYGIASSQTHVSRTLVTRLEDNVIFLDELAEYTECKLPKATISTFSSNTVNDFAALSKSEQFDTRKWIQSVLASNLEDLPPACISHITAAKMHLPISVGDFVDFSCSRNHVLNASEAVFGKRELPPAFDQFPIGYHGRTSTIVVSGTPVVRPSGQYRGPEGGIVFGPTKRLDYELEVAAVIGKPSTLGTPVKIADADEHIFGLVLLNDWSARDIQGLEMTPLGPLHGKSFATTISPWIITLEALSPSASALPPRNPDVVLPTYLQDPSPLPSYTINLSATVSPSNSSSIHTICTSKFSSIYWTLRDLVAQQTINGCSLRTGDLLATGTISGETDEEHGCLMELAKKGGVSLAGAEKRVFFEDGDEVVMTAVAGKGVGFGDCAGRIVGAKDSH